MAKKNNDLIWNVWFCDLSGKNIEQRNVFNLSCTFNNDFEKLVKRVKKENLSKKDFEDAFRRICLYSYWAKREYEVCIADLPWFSHYDDAEKIKEGYARWVKVAEKVDVYTQLLMNWDRFVDYTWAQIKE